MSYFYGPVSSRRLGFSLGVDLFPKKTCSFNCIYCQLGKTSKKTLRRLSFANLYKLRKELREILRKKPKIDYITISGSGEPTLHKNLDKIISLIKKETKNNYPICVITNSSLLYRKDVRKELRKADLLIPSLDSASPQLFKKINRPHSKISLSKIIKGLISLRKEFKGKIWLEIMLVKGLNDTLGEAKKIKKVVEKIAPDKIHLNLPTRPTPTKIPIPNYKKLGKIKKILGKKASIVISFLKTKQKRYNHNIKENILEFLRRRPADLEELSLSLGENPSLVIKYLNTLLKEKKIKKISHKRRRVFLSYD